MLDWRTLRVANVLLLITLLAVEWDGFSFEDVRGALLGGKS